MLVEFWEHKLQLNESWNWAQGNNFNYILWFDIFENMVYKWSFELINYGRRFMLLINYGFRREGNNVEWM